MYADDTVVYFSANCCQNIEYHLNADLANLAEPSLTTTVWPQIHRNRSSYCLVVIGGCKPAKVSSLSLITKTLRVKIQSSILVLSFIRIWLGMSMSNHWLRKWIKELASIAFGCASRIIQCFNKTSLRLCWYHLGTQRQYYINAWFTGLAK